jgi:regulation of enolase protein 1 (concanavalin A-like superfamily)
MNDQLDFRLADRGDHYTLEAQTEAAYAFLAESGLAETRFDHDNWLKVAVELNRHGYTVRVD